MKAIYYHFLFILLLLNLFLCLKGKLSEELENVVTMKRIIECRNWDDYAFELQRIGKSIEDKSINNFFYHYATIEKDINKKELHLNKLMNIDANPKNDLLNFQSIFIKENLTDFYNYSISHLYTGDKFLFENKYNFITLFNSTVYKYRGIKFYSLKTEEKKGQKYNFEVLETSLNKIFDIGGEIVPWHKLTYYTNTETNNFDDLQINGILLISAINGDNNLIFYELEINTLQPKRIIYHLKDLKTRFPHVMLVEESEQYSLHVFRNRFALFVYIPHQMTYSSSSEQYYLAFDLNVLKRYSRYGAGPYDYYFIQEPKKLKINGISQAEFCQIFSILELSNKNLKSSEEEQKIEEENLIKLDFDLLFFYCFQSYRIINDYFYCEIMKLNLKGDSLNNSNKNLYLDENDTAISLIAPYKEDNYTEINKGGYLLKNIGLMQGYPYRFRICEINRIYDEKNNIFIAKYIAIGFNKNPINEDSLVGAGNSLNYRIFKVYFDLKNNTNIRFDYLNQEQKTINFRKKDGSYLFGLQLSSFDIVNIVGTNKFLIGFYSNLFGTTQRIDPDEKNESLYLGYIESLFDSECEEKEYKFSEIIEDNNFDILKEVYYKINEDINQNEFISKIEQEGKNNQIAIKFIGCQFKGSNYIGQCNFQNILIDENSNDLILNTKYYYNNNKIVIKNFKNISPEQCLSNIGTYVYRYNIYKLIYDDEEKIIKSEIMNTCIISIDYDFDCKNIEEEKEEKKEEENEESDINNKSDKNNSDKNDKLEDNDDHSDKYNDSKENDDLNQKDENNSHSKIIEFSLLKYILIIGYIILMV